jgi:predicted ATPase
LSRVRPDFRVTDANAAAVAEICRRLDGMPLAIELAAARVRALSLAEILDGLHDRFRLLTGGASTAVRRQQTLRASVDWSHALLTEPERILFRRLAVFLGGFDLDAAQAVADAGALQLYQVLNQLNPAGRQIARGRRIRRAPNAIPVTRDGAPVRAGKTGRVR